MSLIDIEIKKEYRSLIDNIVKEFYIPLLSEAVVYKRAVGFFSSSALAEVSKGIAGLVKNGGKIYIVASPFLSEDDVAAIRNGYNRRDDIVKSAIRRELTAPSDELEADRLNLLANLIADGILDIKIAFTENNDRAGMYHEKMGLITDSNGNTVAFSGSMNESSTALMVNYETIDVYCSWDNDKERVILKQNAFTSIWNNTEPNIVIIDFPELKDEFIVKYKTGKANLKIDQDEIGNKQMPSRLSCYMSSGMPSFPDGFKLHSYQTDAINKWQEEKYRGIFDMATGTGKTYTGLGAVVRLSDNLNGKLAVVIVCPYQHLVEQWVEELQKFHFDPIIGYSASSQKDWKRKLENAIRMQKLGVEGKTFFCFICTNATYSSDFVQSQIQKIRGDCLLLVDEAHNFGASYLSRLLNDKFNYRLALSATIDRYGDESGTQKLYDYFGNKCIVYDLERAISEKKLTRYKYYPVITYLNDDELRKYTDLSKTMQKCLEKSANGTYRLSEKGKRLAMARARLVAAAENKLDLLEKNMVPYVDKHNILVYCGAASLPNYTLDSTDIVDDDVRQIDAVTNLLGNKMHMRVAQFTSKEDIEKRELIKSEFSSGENLQALIAIKCLDEGVNIPSIKTAFILASTTNPKEYIQRRGRVLRLAKGKDFAEIYDFLTLPAALGSSTYMIDEHKKLTMTMVKNELARAFEFARLADNFVEANKVLEEIREEYGIYDEEYLFEKEYDYYD